MRASLPLLLCATPLLALDLEHAIVATPADLTGPEQKAVAMLLDEIEHRTQIRLPVSNTLPAIDKTVIAVLPASAVSRFSPDLRPDWPPVGAEGYHIRTNARGVLVVGQDERGVLFGVGGLLRNLRMERQKISIPDGYSIDTAPQMPLRGHQLGYRPKTNSYDGWSLPMWEQYIRDLAVFGANAIELIPPRSDDDADSPHFPLPPMQMMIGMSQLAKDYGLNCWIWYPAMDRDYSDPKTVESALHEWGEVFRQLPRIDAVFVPGGDPGHTQPKHLMALLEKQTEVLHRYHPKAQMWMSPQSFNREWTEEFFEILKKEPQWLSGIVHGPQVRMSIGDLRKRTPRRYPIRNYPDITHSFRAQFPVPDWDLAFALTEGREPINPRPIDMAAIFHMAQPASYGFLTYSEGCNDDVNKAVWSALGWNSSQDVTAILREYARYFIGPRWEDGFARTLLALERNWHATLLGNAGVSDTLQQLQSMERAATPRERLNWRFQQALYRGYYDAYNRARLLHETHAEDQAMTALRAARTTSSEIAMAKAESELDGAVSRPAAQDLRARVFELAEALFQSIHMQLSVERYQAIAIGRGANLDAIDTPLNNRQWLEHRFHAIRQMNSEHERLAAIDEIVNWTNPGPGGFYDDLGNPLQQPHLERERTYVDDPQFLNSPLTGFASRTSDAGGPFRTSWITHAETLIDHPLTMTYPDVDPGARYKVRIVYAGESSPVELRLTANNIEVHPFRQKDSPVKPVEFDIPQEATRQGRLVLQWTRPPGAGGAGRGCQVAEVWLIRK